MQNTKEDILKNIGSETTLWLSLYGEESKSEILVWNNMMTEPLFLGELSFEIWNDYMYFSTLYLMYHFCLVDDKACKRKIAAIMDHDTCAY